MSTAMSPVTIFVNDAAGATVTGTLDASTVAHLNRTVSDFFELEHADGIDVLTLDLSTVTMCDDAALAAVRHPRARCAEHAGALGAIPKAAGPRRAPPGGARGACGPGGGPRERPARPQTRSLVVSDRPRAGRPQQIGG